MNAPQVMNGAAAGAAIVPRFACGFESWGRIEGSVESALLR